jgi:hypothetical protein
MNGVSEQQVDKNKDRQERWDDEGKLNRAQTHASNFVVHLYMISIFTASQSGRIDILCRCPSDQQFIPAMESVKIFASTARVFSKRASCRVLSLFGPANSMRLSH